MSQEDKHNQNTRKRSGVMKLLGSTKITPILGLAALISILYYKNKSTKTDKKKAKVVTNVDKTTPVLAPLAILGRTRDGGPMLTKSLFSRGDLIVRKRAGKFEVGMVHKDAKSIQAQTLGGKTLPLLAWVKAGNGRFALLRVKKRSDAEWKALRAALKTHANTPFRKLHQDLKVPLSAPLNNPKLSEPEWLQLLLKQSHYNDFVTK